ncbi:hypothetical protein PI125_g23997 [Phytophthora idaei]|nr:hypothetical protein PI125_g23997 [Phytophthora idaei]
MGGWELNERAPFSKQKPFGGPVKPYCTSCFKLQTFAPPSSTLQCLQFLQGRSLLLSSFLLKMTTTMLPVLYAAKASPRHRILKLGGTLARSHAATYEDEFRSIPRREGSLDAFVKGDEFSRNIYHWLDGIIMENRELGMCEKVKARKYTRLSAKLSGKKVGFAIDTWTDDGTHFVAIIGITKLGKILLRFTTLPNEANMSADAIIEVLGDVFDMYGIEAAQLCFYVCDHASVNVAIARKTQVPMIECSSHRFNLAMQALMCEHSDLLDKMQQQTVKLNTIKNRHHLREVDALMPVYRNATGWSSTFAMVDRYFRIYDKLNRLDDGLADFIPPPGEPLAESSS